MGDAHTAPRSAIGVRRRYFIIDPADAINPAFALTEIAFGPFGFQLEMGKGQISPNRMALLRTEIDITDETTTARLPERKKSEITNELIHVPEKRGADAGAIRENPGGIRPCPVFVFWAIRPVPNGRFPRKAVLAQLI